MRIVSRQEAIESKLPRYFTGEPCRNGHVAERATVNHTCAECKRNADRKQYERDPQKFVRKAARWVQENPRRAAELRARPAFKAKTAVRAKAWRAVNGERHRAYSSKWASENAPLARAHSRNRRARLAGAEGCHTAADVSRLLKLQRGECAGCRVSIAGGFHIDHITPLARGGTNWPNNLQLLCADCNWRKHAKDPITWRQEQGALL